MIRWLFAALLLFGAGVSVGCGDDGDPGGMGDDDDDDSMMEDAGPEEDAGDGEMDVDAGPEDVTLTRTPLEAGTGCSLLPGSGTTGAEPNSTDGEFTTRVLSRFSVPSGRGSATFRELRYYLWNSQPAEGVTCRAGASHRFRFFLAPEDADPLVDDSVRTPTFLELEGESFVEIPADPTFDADDPEIRERTLTLPEPVTIEDGDAFYVLIEVPNTMTEPRGCPALCQRNPAIVQTFRATNAPDASTFSWMRYGDGEPNALFLAVEATVR
ncbi:MAG TPA: hypothetical protein RMF84_15480 [Polyangiaceae bacterium LLY-WYZ-14_1]|nr:hypothetical protein [Polyangiaceae bacterium LLY-WYZ-14_1]